MSKKWNTSVIYDTENDGGGTFIAPDYYYTISSKYNKVFNNCLEWCAGPGFIGYNLLEKQVVKKISFLEIADSPIENLKETSASLDNKNINIYQGNELNCIPKQQFDLIVGNPPHFLSNVDNQFDGLDQRIYMDPEWNIHKSFFQQVENYLTDEEGRTNTYCHEVEVKGPSKVVYGEEGKKLLSCGARVVIETESDIEIVR